MYHRPMEITNWLFGPGNFFPGPLGLIINLLFWALLIGLAIKLIAGMMGGTPGSRTPESSTALEILRERYARGELSREEFQQMKKDLD